MGYVNSKTVSDGPTGGLSLARRREQGKNFLPCPLLASVVHYEGVKGLSRHILADEPGCGIPRPLDPFYVQETIEQEHAETLRHARQSGCFSAQNVRLLDGLTLSV